MNREQAIKKLKEAQLGTDTEIDHAIADGVLCELLQALGYADVVAEYNKVYKC